MKKIISALTALGIVCGNMYTSFAEVLMLPDYEISNEGEITAYHGGETVIVPAEIDGIPVIKIGDMAFFDLGISDVYLQEGTVSIGKSAFEGCNTVSVTIPSTIKIIGERAFANCANLQTVFADFDENTLIGEDAFSGTGHLLFYINCDTVTKAVERNILTAKGDDNFEVTVRHTASDYDADGNVICSVCGYTESDVVTEMPFEDVPEDAWYYSAVHSAYMSKIINGKSETLFDPDAGMTCAEAAKIAASVHSVFNGILPVQTDGEAWYEQYVRYCYEYGIIEEDEVFEWEKNITRAQMAYIFSHCDPFDDENVNINDVPLTDITDISDNTPYAGEILSLYNRGIAVGDEEMNFHPYDNIKRCEAAAIVSRIMNPYERIELPKG